MIYVKANDDGVWAEEFEGKTFGSLLTFKQIKGLFPGGTLGKAEGINKLRIPDAHFKNMSSVI